MRILLIGDIHFRFELPYGTAFPDGRRSEWEAVKKTIQDTAKNCDAIVFLGDQFNGRHNHSSILREFIEFLKDFGNKEIHMLVGNHERYSGDTALDFISRFGHPDWHVYTKPELVTVAGVKTMMIPFMTPALLGVETKEQGTQELIKMLPQEHTPLALVHHAFGGATVYGGKAMDFLTDFFNEIVLPQEVFKERFDLSIGGHIHEKQWLNDKILVAGSIYTAGVNEIEKSIWVWEDGKVEEVPLPVRGIYKVIQDQSYWIPPQIIPKNSIVKCYVTNRKMDIENVKKFLKEFDASLIIEQYPDEREKVHFKDGALDLSVENLIKLYAEAKNLPLGDLLEGFNLIK